MKNNVFFKISVVVLLVMLLFPGCKRNGTEEVPFMAGISTEQSSFTLRNDDIEAVFVVTADEPVTSDMVFALTATGSSDGMYVLNDKNITIASGESSAEGSVIFVASKFTVTEPSLDLRISARSAGAEMYDNASFVQYSVTFEPVVADITASENSVTVGETDVAVNFTVKLSRKAAEDTNFIIDPFGAPAGSYSLENSTVKVLKDTDEITGSVVFLSEWFNGHPEEVVSLSLELTTESPKVVIPENPANPEENINVVITAKGSEAPVE